jgi:RNA polymerase sigma-70 factor (ECF subfamily)
VKTWLLQILTRQAAKAWHRSRHSRKTLSLDASATDDGNGHGCAERSRDDPPAPPGRGGSAAGVEQRIDVLDVLKRLSDAHREVLVLREIRGLSYEEIAQVLGVPRGTVESRLSRARAEFRQKFDGPPGGEES